MTPPNPGYDGRNRDDITAAAIAAVRRALPGWTAEDRTDPGHALIETCADMVEALRDRLNRAADRHRLELLRMLGIRPHPATPARTEVSFQLAAPAPEPVPVPAGVEVSTFPVQEGVPPVIFSTTADALVNPCVLIAAGTFAQTRALGGVVEGRLTTFERPGEDVVAAGGYSFSEPPYHLNLPSTGDFPLVTGEPMPGPMDSASAGTHTLAVLSVPVPGTQVTFEVGCPALPVPLPELGQGWEAWQGSRWVPCRTAALAGNGHQTVRITLVIPATHSPTRLLLHPSEAGQRSPRQLRDVGLIRYQQPVKSLLLLPVLTVAVPAVQAHLIQNEELGTALGTPGERLRFSSPPLVNAADTLTVEAAMGGTTHRWAYVPSLANSGPRDRHFTLDPRTGEAVFGPVASTAKGLRQYGAPLTAGALIRAPRYLTGGGARGNVPARTVTVLRAPLPYISAVTNPEPATGGTEAESPEAYAARLPLGSAVPERAVVPRDYEELALAASAGMARIHYVRAINDDALDPAWNYRLSKPATTKVRFTIPSGVSVVPKGTQVSTANGEVIFTTTEPATRGAVRKAGLASLRLDPSVTGGCDPLMAEKLTEDAVSGPFREGGGLVLALLHIPEGVGLAPLTLWVSPDRHPASTERMALSVFLPRSGTPWWDLNAPAAYEYSPVEPNSGRFPLRLDRSPRWRPKTDIPAASAADAVPNWGRNPVPKPGGAWLALQIRDPAGSDTTKYTVYLDEGSTQEVKAEQFVARKPEPVFSKGVPGQSFPLMEGKLCADLPDVQVAGQRWVRKDSFTESHKNDPHYVVNAMTGVLYFGPEVKDGSGNSVQRGKVPPDHARIDVGSYHSTLGAKGNGVPEGDICRLLPPVGGVSVWNTEASSGGEDGYTDTSGGTLQTGVQLLVIPFVTADERGWFPYHMLTPSQDAYDTVRRALQARQPAGVPVWLQPPAYLGIRFEAHVLPRDYQTQTERSALAAAAERALYAWFNPVDGGPEGNGWPLGRPVYVGDAHRVLERVPGVARVGSAVLFTTDKPATGEGSAAGPVAICGEGQTVYSMEHRVTVAETPWSA